MGETIYEFKFDETTGSFTGGVYVPWVLNSAAIHVKRLYIAGFLSNIGNMMFPLAKRYLIALCGIIVILATIGNASAADTVTINEYYVEEGRLVVHLYYNFTGTRTLEVWAQDPLEENSLYFISEKTVSGRGLETIVGECCFRIPNRYEGKTTKCCCSNPSIRIE